MSDWFLAYLGVSAALFVVGVARGFIGDGMAGLISLPFYALWALMWPYALLREYWSQS
ncbi:MAG: hypothetical protein AAF650_01440 [Pseudomonadota bacterium]